MALRAGRWTPTRSVSYRNGGDLAQGDSPRLRRTGSRTTTGPSQVRPHPRLRGERLRGQSSSPPPGRRIHRGLRTGRGRLERLRPGHRNPLCEPRPRAAGRPGQPGFQHQHPQRPRRIRDLREADLESHLRKSRLPPTLADAHGIVTKPAAWQPRNRLPIRWLAWEAHGSETACQLPGWRNGRRTGLKIPGLRSYGFESHPRYQEPESEPLQVPLCRVLQSSNRLGRPPGFLALPALDPCTHIS